MLLFVFIVKTKQTKNIPAFYLESSGTFMFEARTDYNGLSSVQFTVANKIQTKLTSLRLIDIQIMDYMIKSHIPCSFLLH